MQDDSATSYKEKLEILLESLKNVSKSKDMALNSKVIKNLNMIYDILTYCDTLDYVALDNDFDKLLLYLLESIYDRLLEFVSGSKEEDEKYDRSKSKIYKSLITILGNLRGATHRSSQFCDRIQENSGLEVLFKFFKNKAITKRITDNNDSFHGLLEYFLSTIANLSLLSADHAEKWQSVNALSILIDLAERISDRNDEDNRLRVFKALANIAKDEEIDRLPSLHNAARKLADIIKEASYQFEQKRVERNKFVIRESKEPVDICVVSSNNTVFGLVELLESLYHMCVNDGIKQDVYEKYNMSKYLRNIVYNGNDVEVAYALKLLWQLCYNKKIAEDVRNDQKLFEFIENCLSKGSKNSEVLKHSNGIVWLLNPKLNSKNIEMSNRRATQKHIMISYNRESREMCLRIKEELEKLDYKIWIDVNDIHGSSLDSMAKAIENSFCVLMCITEKYKLSNYCRAEAEYTFGLNRPFIPIMMQQSYKPDGWLGIIMGSKIFIDFTKYNFEICMQRLQKEIQQYAKSKPEKNTATTNPTNAKPPPTESNAKKEILKWTQDQVEVWIKENNFHSIIKQNIFPSDGEVLQQIYLMLKSTPEFFNSLFLNNASNKQPILIKDVAYFIVQLNKLFKEN